MPKRPPPVLAAYLDETGINADSPICAVTGWVASVGQWQLFEERWERASGGVTFHGSVFFARDRDGRRVGAYSGWSDAQAAAYVDRLLTVLERGWLTAFGTIVDVNEFMALSETQRHYLTGRVFNRRKNKWVLSGAPTKPYFFCVSESFNDVAECVRQPGSRVDMVFDEQQQYEAHARNLFLWNKQHVEHLSTRLGEISFRQKGGVGALQAADMLAHVCHKRSRFAVGDQPELDSVTVRMRKLMHECVRFVDAEGLQLRLTYVPPEVRAALIASDASADETALQVD
jgi:hypothetical protein